MLDTVTALPSTRPRHAAAAPAPGIAGQVRAVAAVPLAGVAPAPLTGISAPIVEHMRPGDLLIDEAYQRELTPKSLTLIARIVAGWDWLKYKSPVVAMTDRGFEVVDGQHTCIAAACHPDIDTIPVLVVDGSDLQRRAAAFVSHAVDRLQARPAQVWNAAVAAGDEAAVTVRDVLDRAGVTLLPFGPASKVYAPGETIALGAVQRLVDRRGAEQAIEVLGILVAAGLAPITADHVRIADALLCDPDYGLDAERIAAALRDLGPKQLSDAKALAYRARMPAWKALAAVIYRAHAAPKRVRVRSVAVAPEPEEPEPASVTEPAAPRQTIHVRGIGLIATTALAAGVERWRRGRDWPRVWGPAPDDPTCAVPGSFLGEVALIAGVPRWGAVIDRTVAVWCRDGTWPAQGWGPPPDDADCAVPMRFRAG